jgi:hypothetical protein
MYAPVQYQQGILPQYFPQQTYYQDPSLYSGAYTQYSTSGYGGRRDVRERAEGSVVSDGSGPILSDESIPRGY